jgi:hypothetical protein
MPASRPATPPRTTHHHDARITARDTAAHRFARVEADWRTVALDLWRTKQGDRNALHKPA